ncbi:MAG: molybdenum cofactor biosynthesis protein MoaE [Gemmataceae bacterium]
MLEHRLGHLEVGGKDISVAVAVSCPHRAQGVQACRHAIDRLKELAPIWKKENWPTAEPSGSTPSVSASERLIDRLAGCTTTSPHQRDGSPQPALHLLHAGRGHVSSTKPNC